MAQGSRPPPEPWYAPFVLRPGDQRTVAALLALAAVGMLAWYLAQGGPWDTVDADQPPRLEFEFLIDVNRADWPEWMQLPSVGETLARRIVAHRAAHGPFRSEAELQAVPGIGPKTMAAIRPHLTGWAGGNGAPSDVER